uniref:Disease resistance protein At3g14460 n=1 Tax=Elaeis guineensis var. tenera TaxID=51953 RepID=A0A8N4ESG0_ELAGV|nr:putative disease resistance protein At3g14460 [Elaeis guineensis]XP_029116812.1 putative disease resistance protein At3g14460 [Elaeis guineensis]
MRNPTSLGELSIINCPRLRLLSEGGLPFKLESLYIEKCQQLTLLSGMQNLTSLGALTIKKCPKLQIMVPDQLSSMPHLVDIIDCPGLVNWCEIQKISCIQVVSGIKLTISNTWEKIMHVFDDLTSIEHLRFTNSWHVLPETFSISILEDLTIWGCTHIPPISCLPELTSLQSLVLKDCLGVRLLPDELLPSTLKSLVVDSCEDLRCLRLAQQNRDALKELQRL